MTKVSKNIKRLRTDRKMTQTELAEKIHITRQAVSSWESGRTQPDIEMLQVLSDIFAVSLEELIYGEKRNTAIDNSTKTQISTAIIVLSALGSLLVAVGTILILVSYWSDISKAITGIISFLPMLAGQAFALFTFIKKKNSAPFCESAGLIWITGVAATVALANSVFGAHIGFERCLLVDVVLILPIFVLLKSVASMLVYFVMTMVWGVMQFELYTVDYYISSVLLPEHGLIVLVLIVFTLTGILFTLVSKKQLGEVRYGYAKWICALAFVAVSIIIGLIIHANALIVSFAVSIALYAISKKDDFVSSPFVVLGILGCVAFSTVGGFGMFSALSMDEPFSNILAVVIAVGGIIIGIKGLKENPLKIAQISVMMLMLLLNAFLFDGSDPYDIYYFMMPLSFIIAVLFIVQGASENKLLTINLGLISICVLVIGLLIETDMDLLVVGIAMIICGAILLGVNIKLMSKRKKAKEIKEREVVSNE